MALLIGTQDLYFQSFSIHLTAWSAGYTANASAIKLGSPESTEAAAEAVHAVVRGVLAESESSPVAEAVSSHHMRDPALVTATAFFLVGKLSRIIFLAYVLS